MEEIRFTRQEAADILGCTKQTVCNWVDNGKLPTHVEPYRVNGKIVHYITDTDLLLYFDQELQKIKANMRNLDIAREAKRDLEN